MRAAALLPFAFLLLGCATSAPTSAPSEPVGSIEAIETVESAEPAEIAGPISPPTPDPSSSCTEIVELTAAGDHKQSADAMEALRTRGIACPPEAEAAFEVSRETLRAADELTRVGLEQRDRGEISAARSSFEQALALYPRYHWVRTLVKNLPNDNSDKTRELRQRATESRSQGEFDAALELLEQALELEPDDSETSELISELKTQIAFRHLANANQAAAEGRIEEAAAQVTRAIAVRPEVPAARLRVVEDARNLGLSLFSAGELIQARDLWRSALELDDTDPTLLEYLSEVEARLDSLTMIKEAGNG